MIAFRIFSEDQRRTLIAPPIRGQWGAKDRMALTRALRAKGFIVTTLTDSRLALHAGRSTPSVQELLAGGLT